MEITALKLTQPSLSGEWELERVQFKTGINLLVGASGVGKTRTLNTIFNLARYIVGDSVGAAQSLFPAGTGYIEFNVAQKQYIWSFDLQAGGTEPPYIKSERVEVVGETTPLMDRNQNEASFKGKSLPKLPKQQSIINVLREEAEVKPIHQAFQRIKRRSFQGAELENAGALQAISENIVATCKNGAKLESLWHHPLTLSSLLKLLQDFYRDKFDVIQDQYKRVFPNVESFRLAGAQELGLGLPSFGSPPILLIKEKGVAKEIKLMELSSGMLKVLLLITDVVTQPKPSIYIIDEYENSLGVNAIDFFPSFIAEAGAGIQFLITSHHPYLINAIPVSDWVVLNREGSHVKAKYGEELTKRYGKSHHEKYMQLMNDSFYLS